MKILLTGADGFLGRVTQRHLREAGHTLVTTDRRGTVDVLGDLGAPGFCAGLPDVDAVVHCAAVQYVSPDLPLWDRESYFEHNNIAATRLLAERYRGATVHFVNVGTSMMYRQDGSALYSPRSPMEGQGVYSRSKMKAQQVLEGLSGCWATVVPCIIGGVGREGLFRNFVGSIVRSGRVMFPGRGEHPVNMVHVEDVASLITQVIAKRATGMVNAAAPRPLSISQWVSEIADELKAAPPRVWRLPLSPLEMLSRLTGYRLLAREQLLMLAHPHVLDIRDSLALGWTPRFDNARIARDIGAHIARTL